MKYIGNCEKTNPKCKIFAEEAFGSVNNKKPILMPWSYLDCYNVCIPGYIHPLIKKRFGCIN